MTSARRTREETELVQEILHYLSADVLRLVAATLNVIGSGVLAWRVTGMLAALTVVANAHEHNLEALRTRPAGGGMVSHANSAQKHIERAQRKGLLILGFSLLIFAAMLNLSALLVNSA